MPDPDSRTITRAVNAMAQTGDRPPEAVYAEIYRELKRLADREMGREHHRATLDTTALVHEAFVRLTEHGSGPWDSRWHFYGSAARAMRRILVDGARKRDVRRRAAPHVARTNGDDAATLLPDLLALDEALTQLESFDQRLADVVMLRYFAGLTNEQIADALGVTARTVKRDWRLAKAWLYRRMASEVESGDDA